MSVNSGPLAGAPRFPAEAWGAAAGACLPGFPTPAAEEERSVTNLLVHVATGTRPARGAAGSGTRSVTQAYVYPHGTEVHCKKVLQPSPGCLPLKAEEEP